MAFRNIIRNNFSCLRCTSYINFIYVIWLTQLLRSLKSGNFGAKDEAFEGAEHYTKWMFTYSPPGLRGSVAQGPTR